MLGPPYVLHRITTKRRSSRNQFIGSRIGRSQLIGFRMAALRYISAGVAMFLSVAVASAFAADVAADPSDAAGSTEAATGSAPKKKVRVIDISAESAVRSDHTSWYNRVSKPPVQKNAAKAETTRTHAEAHAEKPRKKKRIVRRAAPSRDAYAAYASEPARERGGFGLFHW